MINHSSAWILATSFLVMAVPAAAQNANKAPNSGSVSLSSGFTPDPFTVKVVAGGEEDGALLPGACIGHISDAPDFRLTYTAGSLPLVFRTVSQEDTTLIINGPDGEWACDDDSYGDGDAEVRFKKPLSGVYDVWVGKFGDDTAEASLRITETP